MSKIRDDITHSYQPYLIDIFMKPVFQLIIIIFLCIFSRAYADNVNFDLVVADRFNNENESAEIKVFKVKLDTQAIKHKPLILKKQDIIWTSKGVELSTDSREVKPVIYHGEKAFLITTDNGVKIISYTTPAKLLFSSEIVNNDGVTPYTDIHPVSAELLPDGSVALADKTGYIYLMQQKGKTTVSESIYYPLEGAQSVYWDPRIKRLYALGYRELKVYDYSRVSQRLLPRAEIPFLQHYYDRCKLYKICQEDDNWKDGGHDLYPNYASKGPSSAPTELFLTTGEHVFILDIEDNQFSQNELVLSPYPSLYQLDSYVSQQVQANGLDKASSVVLKKGGVRAISQVPGSSVVLAYARPWLTEEYHYSEAGNEILVSTDKEEKLSIDLQKNNEHKILFDPELDISFYSFRVIPW